MKLLYWLLVLILAGCTSFPKTVSSNADRTLFYPLGVYQHDVKIKTQQNDEYSFRGVVNLAKDKIVVIGLSPFNTTVFRLEENRKTGKISTEVFYEALEKRKESLVDFYMTLRSFLVLKKDGKNPGVAITKRDEAGRIQAFMIQSKGESNPVEIEHYDDNDIADKIQLHHPRFEVTVKVIGYEI